MKNYFKNNGFTIIELIVVMIIIVILSVTALVRTSGLFSLRLNSAANRLLSDIVYIRQLSITTQVRHGIRFDVANNNYTVYNFVTQATIQDPLDASKQFIVDFDDIQEFRGVIIASINFGGNYDGIMFDPLGQPYATRRTVQALLIQEGTVALTSQTQTRTAYVTPRTGNTGIR